jgi:Brp/Blh family beta-carotene 15,15'-monooxygenase
MRKISFLIFCVSFVGLCIIMEFSTLSFSTQLYWSILLIMLLGIPHGAIDHVLFLEKSNDGSVNKASEFYAFYFSLMIFYFVAWMLASTWSLIVFLFISAYHFGQSQFADLKNIRRSESIFIHTSWGVSILSGLLMYNYEDVIDIFQSSPDLSELVTVLDLELIFILLSSSSIAAVVGILWLGYAKKVSSGRVVLELLTLGIIHACFYALPIIIGFTIYFTTIHSLTVMSEEFEFLKKKRNGFSILQFVQLLAPFTFLSIIGSVILIVITRLGDVGVSDVLLVFILLSLVTLPHSIVMDGFYEKFHKRQT